MNYNQQNNKKPHWWFYLGWVFLNNIVIVLAWYISWALMTQLVKLIGGRIEIAGQSRITEDFLFIFLLLPVIGLLAGLVQYILLRPYLPRMAWWIAATFLSWIMPFVTWSFFTNLFASNSNTFFVMLGLLLIGASLALPQWWMLRQRIRFAYLWILAYGLGWGMIGLLDLVTPKPVTFFLAIALVPNITTGLTLWLLMDQRIPQKDTSTDGPGNQIGILS